MATDKQKSLGQYFTSNINLLDKLYQFVKNTGGTILEPSYGQGHIIKYFRDKRVTRDFLGIEIDDTLEPLEGLCDNTTIVNEDFLKYDIQERFTTIVGNPPYFKLKTNPNSKSILKVTNAYVAFIEKAYELLAENGELVFVIPSDFFKLTSAKKLKELMINNGSFTDIYHPHDENLFDKASQDVIIFRYQKNLIQNHTLYNENVMNVVINDGNIYFRNVEAENEEMVLSDIFDIKVGMVSGAESIYNSTYGNTYILTATGYKKEILLTDLLEGTPEVISYLEKHKKDLMNRKIRQFNDTNWFQWGCLRNIKFMKEHHGKPCLYSKVLTRNDEVFSMGTVQFYDGSLLCMYPKQNISTQQLEQIKNYLNTTEFLKHFLYSGRYKVGQKTLSDCFIPKHLVYHE
jgi:adenine-specific DNA-methyltransferase